jgi:uncharacterized membrane protein
MTRSYTLAHERPRQVSALGRRVPWVFGLATIAAQIAYPLTDGDARTTLTIATVVLFFLASVSHAWIHRGLAWAVGLVVVAGGGGLLAEAVGTESGIPFGDYAYAGTLGWEVAGVPAIIPLAWTMMAYPSLLVGRWLAGRRGYLAGTALGALALATWDLFLDPQMVDAGHWRWADPTPSLPGIEGIPATNYAGWLLVSLVVVGLLNALLPYREARDALPATLYLWTYASSVLAHAVFFDRPTVALAGGIGMGLLALPFAWSRFQSRA